MSFIFLDTETTGFRTSDEILQLSIIDDEANVLFNKYFKPEHNNSWLGAERVNHISPDMVADKETFINSKKEIEKILMDAELIVGYNLQFDIRMLKQNGISFTEDYKLCDIMLPFAGIYHEPDPKRPGQYKYQKLQKCAEYYGYKGNNYHNALGDCYATLYCFLKMREVECNPEKALKK